MLHIGEDFAWVNYVYEKQPVAEIFNLKNDNVNCE